MKKTAPFLFLLVLVCLPLQAQAPNLSEIVRKIEAQRGFWIQMQASLRMEFSTPDGKKAFCRADLVYNRLDEKILLKGFNDQNQLLFVFRTDDRNFDLYLPRQNTVFSGTIFDLEDSPEIHSHLKALDLYRSLKPSLIDETRTQILSDTGDLVQLGIQTNGQLSRSVYTDRNGNTLKEVYYRKDGKPRTLIERNGFETVEKSAKESFSYPGKIRIESYAERGANETVMLFKSVEFSAGNGSADFNFDLPENTRRADVGESFKKQQALALN